MTKPRILFMGTPAFALPALDTLLGGSCPIIAVVTQPDRPAGRGQKEVAPPVKLLAQKSGVPVLQPQTVKDPSFLEKFYLLKPDMVVVAAFGQILPKMIIDFPPLGCLNIHPSLLPKYRGAAPLNWSIIRGEKKTGVTIMLMDEGMDSGDILAQEETLLGDEETYGQLHDRLAKEGAALLIKTIAQVISGKAHRRPQDPSNVTFAPRLTRETCNINWQQSAVHIVNLIRGLCPSPAAYTFLDGQLLKIYTAVAQPGPADQPPGTIGNAVADGLPVAASDGHVILKNIQLAGKKKMLMTDFLRGYRLVPGSILGSTISK
ncbi:MAG: methionyl-tRNA formyltransferase [Smithellaceae bacterium]|nr:methionyl-tRNA formyltransferase [Smithellaceae bacterium]